MTQRRLGIDYCVQHLSADLIVLNGGREQVEERPIDSVPGGPEPVPL